MRFPSLASARRHLQTSCVRRISQHRWPIWFILGEHGPGHARQLIRQSHCGHVTVGAGCELGQPRTQTARLLRALLQDGASPVHEESSQVRVPAFANPEQLLLAPGGIFARDDSEPG